MRRAIIVVAVVICLEILAWKLPTWLTDFVSLEGHRDRVSGIVSLDQNSMIATASMDGSWRLYSNNGKLIRATPSDGGGLTSIVADEANQRVVTSSLDGMIRIWGLPRAVEQRSIKAHDNIQWMAIDAGGRLVVSTGYDGLLRIWQLENGAMVFEKKLKTAASCLAMHPESIWLLYSDAPSEAVIWSIRSKTQAKRLTGFQSQPSAACFSPDGSLLIIGQENGDLSVWDTSSWRKSYQCLGHTEQIHQIAFSNDGKTFWTGSKDTTIRRWNQSDGTAVGVLDRHRGPVLCLDESVDGDLLTGGNLKNATIWTSP
jgi:WD40 repeat protein